MHKMNPVVHFELPAENRIRMSEFYANAFGWKTQFLGEDMGNYTLVTTGDTDENGMLRNNGNINGGFYPKQADAPAQYPNVVIAVDDLQESMNKIKEAGGTLLGEPTEVPGHGIYISFFDPEGNRSSIIQPSART